MLTPTKPEGGPPDHDAEFRHLNSPTRRSTAHAPRLVAETGTIAQLRAIAATADAHTAALDGLRTGYVPSVFDGPSPVNVALAQAAAAAHDLSIGARHVLDILAELSAPARHRRRDHEPDLPQTLNTEECAEWPKAL